MNMLDSLLLLAAITVLLMLILQRWPAAGWLATLAYAGQSVVLILMAGLGYGGDPIQSAVGFEVFGLQMSWRFDALSWFFALITVGCGFFASLYASGEWSRQYQAQGHRPGLLHLAMALNVFSMLLLLASGDFLSLFIGWELVSWSGFLLMTLMGGVAATAALRYITYAIGGAMAIIAGLAIVISHTGSLQYGDFVAVLPSLSLSQVWVLIILFGGGFAVKMGLIPLHLWQAAAYAESPGPGSAFLGAISSRMGLYAIIVVLIQLIGLARVAELEIPFSFLNGQTLIAWIAAITIVLPTYTALRQNDARMLLVWHGIGQGGYMLLGVMTGTALGSAGGLMHIFTHASYQLILLFSVFAVVHRTGTADLNKLGGLITRMPFSFIALLVGIIGLAGLPPMNGFVSKWMIYRSLMIEGMPLLFIVAIIGTLGTILSVYKLIHNIFLGQLRLEHQSVREAPWSMVAPMLIVAAVVFLTGLMPGLVLDWIAAIQQQIGLPVLENILGGVDIPKASLDMLWVTGVLFGGFAVGAVLFYSTGRSKHVHQLDNYAGGHFLTADTRYQYSDNFYVGLMHLIGPWYRWTFAWIESSLHSLVSLFSSGMQRLYRTAKPSYYLLVTLVLILYWVAP